MSFEKIDERLEKDLKDKKVNVSDEIKTAFLDYAMSVIVSRALPDVRDGLKPVHRRIIYSMNELGVQGDKPYKKSARIIGDTMGKYHPHGDNAIYEALVRLAQDFSSRYPLVDGHGNFGSIDGDSAAAMRYTEARMAKITAEMVRDINKNTIDYIENYDGSEMEPVVLPSKIPNVLVNGTTGIAVGMATNIPPHNLGEVIDAIIAIIKEPKLEISDLLTYIQGPDFPTGGTILGKEGIRKAYTTGNGSIVTRAKCDIERNDNGKDRIIVSEIPYQVNKTTLIQKIVDLVKKKEIEGIQDLRDESNRHGMRIIIEIRKGFLGEVILNKLYKMTQLQTTFGANLLAIVENQPKVLNLKEILNHYLKHQEEIIKRRTTFDLEKAMNKVHLLRGLKIASDNIDDILEIIKKSENADLAITSLTKKYKLSDKQAKAILDMKLQRLTGLERKKLSKDIEITEILIKELKEVLDSKEKLFEIIEKELLEIRRKFADQRKTEIINQSFDIDDEDLIPKEEIVIPISHNGYIKRVNIDTYKTQHRGGTGVRGMSTHDGDFVEKMLITNTHIDILFFTSKGKVYKIRAHQIPEFVRQSKGIPIINLLNIDKGESIKSVLCVDDYNKGDKLLFATQKGISKRVDISQFQSVRQTGKIALSLKEGDELFAVKKTNGNEDVIFAASNGKVARFSEANIRTMGRVAAGVKAMNVEDAKIVGLATSSEGEKLFVITEKGYGKMSPIDGYRKTTNRGSKGVKTIKVSEKNGNLHTIKVVNGDEELLIISNKGTLIRTSLEQVATSGRNTMGVRVIRLKESSKVASIAVFKNGEKEEIIDN